jgi:hypothetical protein
MLAHALSAKFYFLLVEVDAGSFGARLYKGQKISSFSTTQFQDLQVLPAFSIRVKRLQALETKGHDALAGVASQEV